MKRWIRCFGKWLALAVLILAAGFCYSCGRQEAEVSLLPAEAVQELEEAAGAEADRNAAEGTGERAEADRNATAGAGERAEADGNAAEGAGAEAGAAGMKGTAEAGTGFGNERAAEAGVPSAETAAAAVCVVYVCGEVAQPGIYELQEGQRVYEAIALAGGFTEAAAQAAWNLAEPVYDGMMLEVPDEEHAEAFAASARTGAGSRSSAGAESAAALVNINTASKEQLTTLRGIGDARAEDIIRYREEHGGFGRIEDIMKVPGIKTSAFEKIKDDISVGP